MATFTIPSKSSISSVDGSADLLLIYDFDASALKKTTRNTFLGLSSAPLGTTDTQSPTNKTFDNSNIFTVRDDRFTLQDSADTTKQAVLQLSGITTGTTRTYTLPDNSSTLVDLSATQTLTNKTLTSPTINTATISNPTLTVDTVSEFTGANGVTVDGVNIKDGALNTNNSVVAANITASAVQPNKLLSGTGTSWVWQSWAPSYTNFTPGDGTLNYAVYTQIGKTVHFRIKFTLGSTSSVSGSIRFTVPVTAASGQSVADDALSWGGQLNDATGQRWFPFVIWISTTTLGIQYLNASANLATVNSTAPFTWATSDVWAVAGTYEAA